MRRSIVALLIVGVASVCGSDGFGQTKPTPPPKAPPRLADSDKAKSDDTKKEKQDEREEPKQKPFAALIKKATATERSGLFRLYRTDEKVYLEIEPNQWDKPYMLSLTCESGLGERGIYAAQMCGEAPVVFHKEGKHVQLIARNPRFTAEAGTPIARAVDRSFSESIMGMSTVDSLPHPERKSELIDLGALLLTDLPNMGFFLESAFRVPYKQDRKGSTFGRLKAFVHNVEIEVRAHYATERLPVPPPPGAGPQPPLPQPPRNVPDPRSLLLVFRYSLSDMPPAGYRPRLADDRIGHFFNQAEDYSTDVSHEAARRYVTRWRLEKADPGAASSAPKQPVVFWLENTVPVMYRDAVRDGVLMWNKAFEKIGFTNAIEVRQQPDDADWDPADVRYNTIRWFTTTDAAFAIGPSRANPFTGEIYDADIAFSEMMTRLVRREAIEEVHPVLREHPGTAFQPPWSASRARAACDLPYGAAADAAFAFDVLAARGLDPAGAEADDFVRGFLKAVTAHEVGHTLGLRHNFHASTIHTFEQLQDTSRTSVGGLTSSVMDYIPTNIAARGAMQGEMFQSTLGPYDHWAVEYAYKQIDATSPEGELKELRSIAARGADPLLAYATDEDAGFLDEPFEMDPLANRFDLGSEPIKFYAHRVQLGHELWRNAESGLVQDGDGYQILRRSFTQGFGSVASSLALTAKYIGGVRYHRDHVGDPNGRVPFDPVPAPQQRAALDLLKRELFAPGAFVFSPAFLRKLAGERFPDWTNFDTFKRRADVPLHAMILEMQTRVLDRLLHPVVLGRVLDAPLYTDEGQDPFRLHALFEGLQESIWRDASTPARGPSANSHRRALQRAHLRRMAELVTREGAAPEDARSLARHSLASLRDQLRQAAKDKDADIMTRAHLDESIERINQVLNSTVQRGGF
jgi:hypothetical protein